ncbi:15980_t:CDS:2 [Funneliformis caledonium]|uniref:15980_t:CDS:1 n=1 Tax=Funneliformis caledonium TaxID=1117310 RepID=A0A9N8VTM8_9GLOM|nr:15980_t:CDS:2 [Funneliformis caledonium]
MAFKNSLTNSQDRWKVSDTFNTLYREKDIYDEISLSLVDSADMESNKRGISEKVGYPTKYNINNSTTMSCQPKGGSFATMALLATQIQALESELITVGKRKNSKRKKNNFDINTTLSSKYDEKIHSPISLENDLLQYKKHERDDSYSDSSLQFLSSNNSVSATSTRLTTPVDSNFDFTKSELSPPNTDVKNSFNVYQKNVEEIQFLTNKLEEQQKQHKGELEKLRKEHSTQLNKTMLDYEKSINDQKKAFEKVIQELKDNMEKENNSKMDKLRKELINQSKGNEEKMMNEISIRYESRTEELMRLHDIEKNKIITELKSMKKLKEKAEVELMENKKTFQNDKRSIRHEYEREIEILRVEHVNQLDSMMRGETKKAFMQIKDQLVRMKREGEKGLRNRIEELMHELSEKEAAEGSWIKDKREKESILLNLKIHLNALETTIQQKEDKIVELQDEHARSRKEISVLNRNKESTSKMIETFQQKTEEIIKDLKRQLDAKTKSEGEVEPIVKTLREQLNNADEELSSLRVQLSNLELKFNEESERCEDLEKLIEDKSDMINKLQLKLERRKTETEELESSKKMDLQNFKERQEQSITLLRTKMEIDHKKELQELRDRLVKEYEIKIKELADQNSRIERNSVQNSETVEELKETTRRLAGVESAFKELNAKHQQLLHKNQQLSNDISVFRSKVELLETDNFELKENNRLVISEKKEVAEKLTNDLETVEKQKESLSKLLEEHQNGMRTLMKEMAAEREVWSQKESDLSSNYEIELRDRDSELEELRSELDHMKKHSEGLEQLLQVSQDYETKQLELSQKYEEALRECANKENEILNLEMFKKQSQARIESYESSTSRLTAKLRTIEADADRVKQNADTKINDLQSRLRVSMTEIEDLHNQVSDLKQKLIEGEAMIQNNSRSQNRDGPNDTFKLNSLTKQVEKYKATQQNLEVQIVALTQKLQVVHQDYKEEKAQIFNDHQRSLQAMKQRQDDEIAKLTETMQSRLAALEKLQRNIRNATDRFSNGNAQRLSGLENSLRESRSECEKLKDKLIHIQQKFEESINEKDKVTKEINDMRKRVKCLEVELQEVIAKNVTLVIEMSGMK